MNTRRITSAFPQSRPSADLLGAKTKQSTVRGEPTTAAAGLHAANAVNATSEALTRTEDAEADEQLLRQFDMTSRYGPVSGITRLQRWERAAALGLQPPEGIKRLILKHGEASCFNQHVFSEGKL
jgi:DNA polymerase delta subunit 4